MPAPTVADPSTRLLSEVTRHLVVPSGIIDTLWFDVEERCREFGDEFDAWQDGLGQVALGIRADGLFAATIGGITLSIPRQVAKTFIVMRIVVALCTLYPNMTVIWTAHRTRTATHAFGKMKALVMKPAVRPHLQAGSNQGTAIRDANGEQQIPFKNGSVIMFGAREQGFGRGFDEVDIEVFDEAQILTDRALEDMVAATNQSRFPHGALLFYMGTPPRPNDPGEVFALRRGEALAVAERRAKGEDVEFDALYVECSADPDIARADVNDQEQWAIANPSFPHRTPLTSLLRLRAQLKSDESWLREALGVWDDDEMAASVLPNWSDLRREDSTIATHTQWALAVSPVELGKQWASIGKAGRTEDGMIHVEWVEHRAGTRWIVDVCKQHFEANGRIPLRVLRTGAEGAFIPALLEAGVEVVEVSATDYAQATGALIAAAAGEDDALPTLVHINQPSLNKAVRHAVLRSGPSGSSVWSSNKSSVEITPLVAVTVALGGVPQSVPVFSGSPVVILDDWEDDE